MRMCFGIFTLIFFFESSCEPEFSFYMNKTGICG